MAVVYYFFTEFALHICDNYIDHQITNEKHGNIGNRKRWNKDCDCYY